MSRFITYKTLNIPSVHHPSINMDQQAAQGAQQGSNQSGGQEDYLDKGVDFAEKKFGQGKIDPQKERGMNEKVTDGARGMFEKVTGKHIPDKFSN